ncbi:MAG: hypothetical protein H7A38_00540 [Chlamydiales bacterium]|nr:hypothetical protein [Chlamydiales bacterium]
MSATKLTWSESVQPQQKQLLFASIYGNRAQLQNWDVQDLTGFAVWLLGGGIEDKDKVQRVFADFPFARLEDDGKLQKQYEASSYHIVKREKKGVLGERSNSLGNVSRKFGSSLDNGALKSAFNSMVEDPDSMKNQEGKHLFDVAKWAINAKPQKEVEKHQESYQTFFTHFPAEKLTDQQQQEITTLRVARDFPEPPQFSTLDKAAEFADRHFSDEINDPVFAGKQRVLIQLTTAAIPEGGGKERFALIHEVMLQLRKVQQSHYAKGYLGKRLTKVVTPNSEEDLVKLFEGGALGLRLHRTLGRSLHGVEWNEEVCSLLTKEEIKALIQKKPAKELYQRLIHVVIARKDRTLRADIDWTQATLDQKLLAKTALFDGDCVETSVYYPLVVGMSSAEVIEFFGKGKRSAELHKHFGLNLEKVEWEDDAYTVLEGKAYVTFLQKRYKTWDSFSPQIKYEMRNKTKETRAAILLAYKGDVPIEEEGYSFNWISSLTLDQKKACAENYQCWSDFPKALQTAFTHEELKEAFDYVVGKQWGDLELLKKMSWENAEPNQRTAGLQHYVKVQGNYQEIAFFAEGLDADQINKIWGSGLVAAKLLRQCGLSQEGIPWDETAGPALNGKALCDWLNRHPEDKELSRFLTNHVDLIPGLSEARKKEAVVWFIDNKRNAPNSLRPYTTRAQHHQLYGLTFGDQAGIVLIGLLSLFGLYQLYKRWKKS